MEDRHNGQYIIMSNENERGELISNMANEFCMVVKNSSNENEKAIRILIENKLYKKSNRNFERRIRTLC